jgi:hypothetical protein
MPFGHFTKSGNVKQNRKKDLLRKIFNCTILISYGSKNDGGMKNYEHKNW